MLKNRNILAQAVAQPGSEKIHAPGKKKKKIPKYRREGAANLKIKRYTEL